MPNNREFEIKMRLDPADVEKFALSGALKGIKPEQKHFRTVYLDDEKHDLARNGFELRVRSDGSHWIQTLKSRDGLDRGEWEAELPSEEPSLKEISDTPAAKFIKQGSELLPVFHLQIDRRSWTVLRDGTSIEVALDTGALTAGSRRQQINEAELELKAGTPRRLFELAEDMTRQFDAPLSFLSKGARGYHLASETDSKSLDLHLSATCSAKSAFQQIANACLRQFSHYEECLRATGDIEALHQARVAIRRLRAAFSMFKPIVRGKDADEVRNELKWISDLLGKARDLDVFVETELTAVQRQHPAVPGFKALVEKAGSMRAAAHKQLKEALRSWQFRHMLLSLASCVQAGDWTREPPGQSEEPFLGLAKTELDRRFKSVTTKKKAVRGDDALKRHRVRIKAKKLRYMAAFLNCLGPGKAYVRTARRLKLLQDRLGALNDAVAGERLLGQIVCEANDPAISFAAGLICQHSTVPREIAKEAVKVYKKLRQSQPLSSSL